MSYLSIAIDGPVAAGKTTQAKALARRLEFVYVDTGAMYRAFAVHKLWLEKECGHEIDIKRALHTFDFDIVQAEDGQQHIYLWGKDITSHLRMPEVSMLASKVSAHPAVRETLQNLQKVMPIMNNVVMEGRDIGTVIIPNATLKVFLTAQAEVRAYRRWQEQCLRGVKDTYEETLALLQKRDYEDSHREIAPLKQAEDAVLVDCTEMSVDETTEAILTLWNAKKPGWRSI